MVSAVSSVSQTYAVYFRTTPRTSIATVRCVNAGSLDEAKGMAQEGVSRSFPDGRIIGVVLAKDSPWPLMDVSGNLVAPKRD